MTPPVASVAGNTAHAAAPPEGSVRLQVLTKRADFLRAARGPRVAKPGFVLQARDRRDESPQIRVGYTCSKKVGNAVARNRAKRRLREVARLILPLEGRPGWDYVLVGRAGTTATLPFPQLQSDLQSALTRLHGPRT
ncbi:MAG: ribonuclease P protein component [Pseudomonadota bacterium]